MAKILREFVSDEKRNYKFRLGRTIASSLAGFIAGAIVASIIWYVALIYIVNAS
jgi:hypothetical protein